LVANMVFNGIFIVLLYQLWATPELKQGSFLDGIAKVAGLHVALAIASTLSSYLNFVLLWRWLKRAGVYQRQPGWSKQWLRLAVSCAAMVVALLLGRLLWPDWTHVSIFTRVWHLCVLVMVGALAYVAALFASGFRMHELRGA